MKPLLAFALAVVVLSSGCDKPPEPTPDGTCGVRGVCLLPDRVGGVKGRWAGANVTFQLLNADGVPIHSDRKTRVQADANGEFRMALNPGRHWVGLYDPKLMKGKAVSAFPTATVKPGEYADLVIDFEQLKIEDVK